EIKEEAADRQAGYRGTFVAWANRSRRGPRARGQQKKPRLGGAFSWSGRGSEVVARRDAEQVGVAVEWAGDGAAAGGGADLRVLGLEVREREVQLQRIAHLPGGADRVPVAIVVGQARGAVREAGRGLVDGEAATQGPGFVEDVLGAH